MELDSFERDLMQWNDAMSVREEERERYRPLVEAARDVAQQEPIAEVGVEHRDECLYCGGDTAYTPRGAEYSALHDPRCPWLLLAQLTKAHHQG